MFEFYYGLKIGEIVYIYHAFIDRAHVRIVLQQNHASSGGIPALFLGYVLPYSRLESGKNTLIKKNYTSSEF